MRMFNVAYQCNRLLRKTTAPVSITTPAIMKPWIVRTLCTSFEHPEMKELFEYLENLKNYEKLGVPRNAGTDSDDGFDLGRMRRLMERLGNPQSMYKVVHVAGTKGKGSTAAFLSSILKEEGYSVGCYTSPHIRTIRERMSLGRGCDPVSANDLCSLFQRIKKTLEQAVEFERGHLSHFEVITAIAFTLFAEHNVDVAVVEAGLGGARDATNIICSSGLAAAVITTIGKDHLAALGGSLEGIALAKSGVIKHGCPCNSGHLSTFHQPYFLCIEDCVVLGGPFLPHIEQIIRDKAYSMCSPVISASDSGNRSAMKGIGRVNGKPCQSCDIVIRIEKDIPLSIELSDVNLLMVGCHQLQNATTATCAALCLRNQGWRISDRSIRTGLEHTQLLGRSQFLTPNEAKPLGLSGSMILLDGAHTQESAKALVNTIHVAFPEARLALVVAMAIDKDHLSFAKEFLSAGQRPEAVCLTEVDVAGDRVRTTSASMLRNCWIKASKEAGVDIIHDGMAEYQFLIEDLSVRSASTVLVAERSLTTSLRIADQILEARRGEQSGIIVITGSLHLVASVLDSVYR